MHGDRVVVRVERHRDADRAEGRIVRILERAYAAHRRPLRRRRAGPGIRRAVRSAARDRHAGSARARRARRGARRDGHGADHELADGDAARARPRRRSAGAARRARRRHDGDHPQVQPAGRAHGEAIAEAKRLGGAVRERDSRTGRTSASGRRSPSTASTRATSTTRSRSIGCRTATSGWGCTSPTSRIT